MSELVTLFTADLASTKERHRAVFGLLGGTAYWGVDETTNVDKDRAEVPWIPANLELRVGPGIDVFGDYEVCPISKEKTGEMQMVCVESVSRLVIKDWNEKSEN